MKAARNLLPAESRQRSYQPINWTSRHRNCVALEMAGLKNYEIAQVMGWDEGKVSITLCDERAQLERNAFGSRMAEKITDVHMALQLHAAEALDKVVGVLQSDAKPDVILRAGFGLLDRAGYTANPKEALVGTTIPAEVLNDMGEVMKDIRDHSIHYETPEPVIEADYELVEVDD